MIEIKGPAEEMARVLKDITLYPYWLILNFTPGEHMLRRCEVDIKVIIEEEPDDNIIA